MRGPRDHLSALPNDELHAILGQLTTHGHIGSVLIALGSRGRLLDRQAILALVADRLFKNQERKLRASELKPINSCAAFNAQGDELPADGIVRLDFPFEARRRFLTCRKRCLDNTEASWPKLCEKLYVHDMVFESGTASEKCMLVSMPDKRSQTEHQRVLFLISLGIRNDCDWGCFCVGRHFIAIDALLPEASEFENAWLYDYTLSRGSGDEDPTHAALECTPALAIKLMKASGSHTNDIYELVHLLALLGGTDGRHNNAFSRFLDARAAHGERKRAKLAKAKKEEEEEEEDFSDSDEDTYMGPKGRAYFSYPAATRTRSASVLPTQAEWGIEYDIDGRSTLRDAEGPIRPRLMRWLAGVERSSLAALVGATIGFGARYTRDLFMERDAEFQKEMDEQEGLDDEEAIEYDEEEKEDDDDNDDQDDDADGVSDDSDGDDPEAH